MPLSEHEQRLLEQIEQSLYAEDPKFARTVRSRTLHSFKRVRLYRSLAAFILGLGALLAGVVTLPGHPSIGIGVGVGGFLIMFAAAWYAFSTRSRIRPVQSGSPAPRVRRSMLARLEDRWERRQDGRGFGG